jgi:hypothetical protein
MELGLFSHPAGFSKRCDQVTGAGDELGGVPDALPAVVTV